MSRRRAGRVSAALLTGAVALGACENGPSQPSQTPQLRLAVPSVVEPGQVVQLRLSLLRGGQVEDVTGRAAWFSSDRNVLELEASAVATGLNVGEVTVRAAYGNLAVQTQVLVLSRGTFRVAGIVRHANQPLYNARVTVASGPQQGQGYSSLIDGRYALYGLQGNVRVRLSKPGYAAAEHELLVTDHLQRDFTIDFSGPVNDFDGRYSLTIVAADSCPPGFPEAARRRTYTMELDQIQTVSLSGNMLDSHLIEYPQQNRRYGTRVPGWISSDGVTIGLWIGDDYYAVPPSYGIVERFGDSVLLIRAEARGHGSPDFVEGTLTGSIFIGESMAPPFEPISAVCQTKRFELKRQ